jgi:hypothetical protein
MGGDDMKFLLYRLFWSLIIAMILLLLCINRPMPQQNICQEPEEVKITKQDLENFRKYLEKK